MCRGRFAGVPQVFLKCFYVDTNFLPKLRKCCHEVMFDLCRKSRVVVQVSSIEMMNFFLEISTISGSITQFPEIVAQTDDDLPARKGQHHFCYCLQCHSTSIEIDLSGWCAAKFFNWFPAPADKKIWEPLL